MLFINFNLIKKNNLDNKKYYELFDWKSFHHEDKDFKVFRSLIPEDVKDIIDIGCGNGTITNRLAKEFFVLGVDRSKEALKFVENDKLISSCDNISVKSNSFDLVFSSELLEHLDDETFKKTICEFKRISKKYILISTPFDESLNKGFVECPKCSYRYHMNSHFRAFHLETFSRDFGDYSIKAFKTFGVKVRGYSYSLFKWKQRLSLSKKLVPYFFTSKWMKKGFCPRCEQQFEGKISKNLIGMFFDILNILISPKKDYWLIVLLEKNS